MKKYKALKTFVPYEGLLIIKGELLYGYDTSGKLLGDGRPFIQLFSKKTRQNMGVINKTDLGILVIRHKNK
jgi:hypothetical protein